MDLPRSDHNVLLCDHCETRALHSHCELCNTNLCIECVGTHISDPSRKHRVEPLTEIGSIPNYPKCINHVEKKCELFCETCDIHVCFTCISSGEHDDHKLSESPSIFNTKREGLRKDLEELKTEVHPQYDEIVTSI
jgi:predicted RNA-binding protein